MKLEEDEFFLIIGVMAFLLLWKIKGIEWVIDTFLQFTFFTTIIWYISQKIHKKFKEE